MGLGSVIPNLALEALGRVSPATNRSSPLTMVCEDVEGRTFERVRVAGHAPQPTSVRWPAAGRARPEFGTERRRAEGEIWTVRKASPLLGERHRKVRTRLAVKKIPADNNGVLSLMREYGLLASVRRGYPRRESNLQQPEPAREARPALGRGRELIPAHADQ